MCHNEGARTDVEVTTNNFKCAATHSRANKSATSFPSASPLSRPSSSRMFSPFSIQAGRPPCRGGTIVQVPAPDPQVKIEYPGTTCMFRERSRFRQVR